MKLLGYSGEDVMFPTEDEMIITLNDSNESSETDTNNEDNYNHDLKFQEPYAIVWDVGEARHWFVGLYLGESDMDGKHRFDHLTHINKNDNFHWERPNRDDIQDALPQQIVPCDVIGKWVYDKRKPKFTVYNADEIE